MRRKGGEKNNWTRSRCLLSFVFRKDPARHLLFRARGRGAGNLIEASCLEREEGEREDIGRRRILAVCFETVRFPPERCYLLEKLDVFVRSLSLPLSLLPQKIAVSYSYPATEIYVGCGANENSVAQQSGG